MRSLIAVIVLLAVAAAAPLTFACSCAPPPPPKEALKGSVAVFSGKCVEVKIDEKGFTKHVTIEVDRVWKGEVGKKVTITTAVHGATCGYGFTTKGDATYLVYCFGKADCPGDEHLHAHRVAGCRKG
ncbi:MAG: hypothetical protein WD768_04600 [Phycisphaeraceae bacterium]